MQQTPFTIFVAECLRGTGSRAGSTISVAVSVVSMQCGATVSLTTDSNGNLTNGGINRQVPLTVFTNFAAANGSPLNCGSTGSGCEVLVGEYWGTAMFNEVTLAFAHLTTRRECERGGRRGADDDRSHERRCERTVGRHEGRDPHPQRGAGRDS
jgi:hypothetical protein